MTVWSYFFFCFCRHILFSSLFLLVWFERIHNFSFCLAFRLLCLLRSSFNPVWMRFLVCDSVSSLTVIFFCVFVTLLWSPSLIVRDLCLCSLIAFFSDHDLSVEVLKLLVISILGSQYCFSFFCSILHPTFAIYSIAAEKNLN